jgi:hypothetical protein
MIRYDIKERPISLDVNEIPVPLSNKTVGRKEILMFL